MSALKFLDSFWKVFLNQLWLCSSHKISPDFFSCIFQSLLCLVAEYVSLCRKTVHGTSNILQVYFFLGTAFLPCIPWHLCLFCSQEGWSILFGIVHSALILSFFPEGGFLASFFLLLYRLYHFLKFPMSCGDEEEEDKDSKWNKQCLIIFSIQFQLWHPEQCFQLAILLGWYTTYT